MKNYIAITVKSKKQTHDLDYGRAFLSSFIKTDVCLTPEYLDTMEDKPISRRFVDMEHALEKWSTYSSVNMFGKDRQLHDTAKWLRKSVPIYSCYILNHTKRNMYNDIVPSDFSFKAKWCADIDWFKLFYALCSVADAQVGMMHHFTALEIKNPNGDFEMSGNFGLMAG